MCGKQACCACLSVARLLPPLHSDGKIVMWDTDTLESRLVIHGHQGAVLSCSVNEDSTRIVSCGALQTHGLHAHVCYVPVGPKQPQTPCSLQLQPSCPDCIW